MRFMDGSPQNPLVPKSEVKEFPQVLDWLLCQCWVGGLRDGEAELVHYFSFL